jgi:hypothetical protein
MSLDELFAEANKHHTRAVEAGRTHLMEAYEAGKALAAAKAMLPHGTWKDELEARFDGCPESDRVYRRVAEHWEDPRVRDGNGNLKPESIRQFMALIRTPTKEWDEDLPDQPEVKPRPTAQQYLRDEFRAITNKLDDDEAKVLAKDFGGLCKAITERIDEWSEHAELREKFIAETSFMDPPEAGYLADNWDAVWKKIQGWVQQRVPADLWWEDEQDTQAKAAVRDRLYREVRGLDDEESAAFEQHWDELWERLHGRLKELVCIRLEMDYYGDEERSWGEIGAKMNERRRQRRLAEEAARGQ